MRKPILVGTALIATLTVAGILLLAQDKSSRPQPTGESRMQTRGRQEHHH